MASSQEPLSPFENRLLAALPRAEYLRLLPHLKLIHLPPRKILYDVGEVMRYAYFPRGGMISLLSSMEDGRTVEAGMVGNEGVAGIAVILRAKTAPHQMMVQLPGNAMRISGDVLQEEFKRCPALQDLLLRYTHMLLLQTVQSSACNRFHTVGERLCRWLLISRDRLQTDTLHLTQEFLAHMLGVPRTSVTMAASDLQRAGLIRYGRGRIIILDYPRLEAAACECLHAVRAGISQFLAA